jgi:hypothetical protein
MGCIRAILSNGEACHAPASFLSLPKEGDVGHQGKRGGNCITHGFASSAAIVRSGYYTAVFLILDCIVALVVLHSPSSSHCIKIIYTRPTTTSWFMTCNSETVRYLDLPHIATTLGPSDRLSWRMQHSTKC